MLGRNKPLIITKTIWLPVLTFASCAFSQSQSGNFSGELQFGGLARTYSVHVPSSYQKAHSVSLVLAFHGGGGQGKGMARLTGLTGLSDREGFIVAYPDGIDKHWNDGRETITSKVDDVSFISALIDQIARDYSIDRKRVYATGISNGGIFSERLACDLADKIAAIASVAGAMPQNIYARCNPPRPVSVLMFHGTDDPLVPYNGGDVRRVAGQGLGGKVLSVADTIKYWVSHNKCSPSAVTAQLPDKDPEHGTKIRRDVYGQCKEGSEVVLYTIENGGHTWPGGLQYAPERLIGKTNRDINASEIIWDFFKAHPIK